MDEVPARPAQLPSIIHLFLFFLLTLLSFVGLSYTGYRLILAQHLFIQWQVLPSPPVRVQKLLPPWGDVRVLGADGYTYSYGNSRSSNPWVTGGFVPDPSEANRYSPRCKLNELPFSFSLSKPKSILDCRRYRAHVEAPSSYAVLDRDGKIWTWVNYASWSGGFVCFVGVLVLAFVFSPSVAILLMRQIFRRTVPASS